MQWKQLSDPRLARRTAMANPLFGTTRGQVAALFALWGEVEARSFLTLLRDGGVHVVDGNSAAVRAVMDGRADFAMTDTDDVWMAQRAGASIDRCFPDMGDGGTLLIPSSVALVKNGPGDRSVARRLVDFLVSADVERMLATSDSRNIPVRENLRKELGMEWPAESKVSYESIADWMDRSDAAVREILLR